MLPTKEQWSAVAHHEAGHVLALLRHGGTVLWVELCVRADRAGLCQAGRSPASDADRVLLALAGTAAERRWLVLRGRPVSGIGGSPIDFRDAEYDLEEAGGTREEHGRRADAFVAEPRNWAAIEFIARALLRFGAIDGEQAAQCVARSDALFDAAHARR